MAEDNIITLYKQCLHGTATSEEQKKLLAWVQNPVNEANARGLLNQSFFEPKENLDVPEPLTQSIVLAILNASKKQVTSAKDSDPAIRPLSSAPTHRVHFLKTAWPRYAAAVVLIFGIGTALVVSLVNNKNKSLTFHTPEKTLRGIDPGTNKAILTLADGSTVMLDSTNTGVVAQQGGVHVQQKNGQLAYTGETHSSGSVLYNVLSTPRGGQYRLTLPDGTRVWLNAAASIKYPVSFNGAEREVKLTGEAYFEVAANATQPFKVIAGNQEVEVLGTQFNINAYPDEPGIKTTLLEGSVRVRPSIVNNATPVILIPGQQSSLTSRGIKVKEVNTEDETAWKNDLFAFNNTDFESILRQLSRWYDVEFEFSGTLPGKQLIGNVSRNYSIEQVLKMMSFTTGIQYELEGGKIILSSK